MNHVCRLFGIMMLAAPAHAQVYNWATPVDGNWSNGALWDPVGVPDNTGESAVLGLAASYVVTVDVSPTIDSLSITNMNATLGVSASRVLSVGTGGIVNNGTIIVNGEGSAWDSVVDLFAGGAIGGSGEIILQRNTSDANDAQLVESGGFGIFHDSSHTISGSGRIEGLVLNDGLIVATNPAYALEVVGTLSQGATGVLRADGATLGLRNVVVEGGLLEGVNGGVVVVLDDAELSDLTVEGETAVDAGNTLAVVAPGITNNGVLTINPDGSTWNTMLSVSSDATFSGTGQIVLGRQTGDVSDAILSTEAGVTATIASEQTIRGSGLISGAFLNYGTIVADNPSFSLNLAGSIAQDTAGLIVGNGATVVLTDVAIAGGTLTSSNQGVVDVASNAVATVDDVVNAGAVGIRGGGVLGIAGGGLTNNGTLTVNTLGNNWNAVLRFDANAVLNGAGKVVLNQQGNDVFDAQLTTADGVVGTNGAGHTVSGRGIILGDFVNNGVVVADQSGNELQIYGTMEQAGGGVLRGDSGIIGLGNVSINDGAFESLNGGSIEVLHNATATVSGVTNLGQVGIRGNGVMAIGTDGLVNGGTLVINHDGNNWNAVLRFDADAVLDGAGVVVLNQQSSDVFDAQLTTADGVVGTNAVGHTIAGRGILHGNFINNGTIVADVAGEDLVVKGAFHQGVGGVMRGDGAFIALDDGAVTGGAFEGVNGGRVDVRAGGEVFVADVTMVGNNGIRGNGSMVLVGDVENNGVLTINTEGNNWNAELRADADALVGGVGEIVLGQATADPFDARINAQGFLITIGSGQVLRGKGRLDGSILCNGVTSPGIDGTAEIVAGGSIVFGPAHVYEVEIGSFVDANYDRITGSAAVGLDGELVVTYIDSYAPALGDSFPIITGSDIAGSFHTVTAPALPGSWIWKVRYDAAEVVLVISCSADINSDGTVNTQDFLAFLNAWTAGEEIADWNADGSINTMDFLAYLNDWVFGCP